MPHMVKPEENMTNLKDTKAKVTVRDSITLTGKKQRNWNGYQRRDRKLHCMMLSNTAVIPGLHANLFIMKRSLQKGLKATSEGETLILKETFTEICSDEKIANYGGKGFLMTTKFYNSTNGAALFPPKKHKPEGKSDVKPEETTDNNQENTTTKKLAIRKIYAKYLHTKLVHHGEDMMHLTAEILQYIIKGTLEVCEDCVMEKKAEMAMWSGVAARPKEGQDDLPRSYITKEDKLWRLQELDSRAWIEHKTKMVILC